MMSWGICFGGLCLAHVLYGFVAVEELKKLQVESKLLLQEIGLLEMERQSVQNLFGTKLVGTGMCGLKRELESEIA
jgi:hypothetical protein